MNKRVEVESPFQRLAAINVNEHVDKKQNLSYLSWAWALDQLLRADPAANWTFNDPISFGETMMVSCTVTAFGKPVTMHLPVMDHRNQAIKNPDAFQVNKNMMRCLVKAIACHGLGLYIYAGEDLPEGDAPENKEEKKEEEKTRTKVTPTAGSSDNVPANIRKEIEEFAEGIQVHFDAGMDVKQIVDAMTAENYEPDHKVYFWSLLDSKCRTAITKFKNAAKAELATQA